MTNDESLLREVDEGLAEDNLWRTISARGPAIIGAAVALVAGVAGWQFYESQSSAAADKAARAYREVLAAEENDGAAPLRERLTSFLEDAPGGYDALARFQIAAAAAREGDREAALAQYRELYDGGGASARLRDLARLKAAYLALEDGRDAVIAALGKLEADETALGFLARELLGVAALKAGDYQTAETMFLEAKNADDTPAGVRARASEFAALARVGKSNGALEWPKPQSAADAAAAAFEALDGDLGGILGAADKEAVVDSDAAVEDAAGGAAVDDDAADDDGAGDNAAGDGAIENDGATSGPAESPMTDEAPGKDE